MGQEWWKIGESGLEIVIQGEKLGAGYLINKLGLRNSPKTIQAELSMYILSLSSNSIAISRFNDVL